MQAEGVPPPPKATRPAFLGPGDEILSRKGGLLQECPNPQCPGRKKGYKYLVTDKNWTKKPVECKGAFGWPDDINKINFNDEGRGEEGRWGDEVTFQCGWCDGWRKTPHQLNPIQMYMKKKSKELADKKGEHGAEEGEKEMLAFNEKIPNLGPDEIKRLINVLGVNLADALQTTQEGKGVEGTPGITLTGPNLRARLLGGEYNDDSSSMPKKKNKSKRRLKSGIAVVHEKGSSGEWETTVPSDIDDRMKLFICIFQVSLSKKLPSSRKDARLLQDPQTWKTAQTGAAAAAHKECLARKWAPPRESDLTELDEQIDQTRAKKEEAEQFGQWQKKRILVTKLKELVAKKGDMIELQRLWGTTVVRAQSKGRRRDPRKKIKSKSKPKKRKSPPRKH